MLQPYGELAAWGPARGPGLWAGPVAGLGRQFLAETYGEASAIRPAQFTGGRCLPRSHPEAHNVLIYIEYIEYVYKYTQYI